MVALPGTGSKRFAWISCGVGGSWAQPTSSRTAVRVFHMRGLNILDSIVDYGFGPGFADATPFRCSANTTRCRAIPVPRGSDCFHRTASELLQYTAGDDGTPGPLVDALQVSPLDAF